MKLLEEQRTHLSVSHRKSLYSGEIIGAVERNGRCSQEDSTNFIHFISRPACLFLHIRHDTAFLIY